MSNPLIFPMKITRTCQSWSPEGVAATKDLNLVANNLRRLEDNGADIREPRSPYLMPHGDGKVDGGAQARKGGGWRIHSTVGFMVHNHDICR